MNLTQMWDFFWKRRKKRWPERYGSFVIIHEFYDRKYVGWSTLKAETRFCPNIYCPRGRKKCSLCEIPDFTKKSWNSVEIIDFLIRIFFLKLYMNSMAENISVCQISCKNSIGNKSYGWKCSGRVTFFLSPQRHEANFEGRIDFLGLSIWHQIPKLRCIG